MEEGRRWWCYRGMSANVSTLIHGSYCKFNDLLSAFNLSRLIGADGERAQCEWITRLTPTDRRDERENDRSIQRPTDRPADGTSERATDLSSHRPTDQRAVSNIILQDSLRLQRVT